MPVIRHFGRLADGRSVEAIRLGSDDGLQAEVLTYGAILHALSFPVGISRRSLVLQLNSLAQYENDRAYVGPVVGRFANRIAAGRFAIDGEFHQLARNEKGNHLHGGVRGLGKSLWRVLDAPGHSSLRLGLHSPHGEEGYPGNLDVELAFSVAADRLRIRFVARTDAPTPVNLTWHPYFNLGGPVSEHRLRIPASRFLPVGPGLIPTGEIAAVDGTPFDFRSSRKIAVQPPDTHPQLAIAGGYDHCWVIDDGADCHCELQSPQRDLALRVNASGPGLQFYGGQFLPDSYPGLGPGLALEPQGLPDAPNHAGFPSAILRPQCAFEASIDYRVGLTPPD